MKTFSTGYQYIDDTADKIKNQLSDELREELNFVLTKVHSVGVDTGYSAAVHSNELPKPTQK